ncbi:aspartyl protease family protein [Paenibacillus dendritiformis]|uniref:aspartyl protease family protein n=1 Tax=Paenibacillus dendritiformis TaxID=130049 RepID=UPI00365F5E17
MRHSFTERSAAESETRIMKMIYDGQLLSATITVCFRGKMLQITDVIIDTGSSHTVFSPNVLEEIGVTYENGDPVYASLIHLESSSWKLMLEFFRSRIMDCLD